MWICRRCTNTPRGEAVASKRAAQGCGGDECRGSEGNEGALG